MIDEHARTVSQSWQSRQLMIVPGDILLDRVFLRFGVRFKKRVDGPRLASLMGKKEIDGEIVTIIREPFIPLITVREYLSSASTR